MGPADHHLHALGLAQGDADDDDHDAHSDRHQPTDETPSDANAIESRSAPPIVGLLRKAALDDRPRRSLSYRHTDPYEVAVDESTQLEYEIRACKYCDTAFSFKGGTTSAALRHLRLAHPNEFYGAGGAPLPPPGSQQQQQHGVPAELPEEQQHHHQEQRSDDEHRSAQHHQEPQAQQPQEQQPDAHATQNGHLGGDTVGVSNREPSGDANDPQETPRSTPPRVHYHKRRRHEDDHHSAMSLNVNQLAISHFIAHYKQVLPPAKRLAFIKHLAYNDREAAMYNVLDEELQLEFLVQFNGEPVPPVPPAPVPARRS